MRILNLIVMPPKRVGKYVSNSLNEYIKKWVREVYIPLRFHCQCPECQKVIPKVHDSDCAVHNKPAYSNGVCNCSLATRRVKIGA
jgi:hypothetical protein